MPFDKAVETIKVTQKNRIRRNGQLETASKDVSTDEATTTGELSKVARCTKHILATDVNPRCLSVSYY
jgi:hypothetical protein